MSTARNQLYRIVSQGAAIEPGSPEDVRLTELLDTIERDAVHRAAVRLLDMHMGTLLTHGLRVAQGLALAIVTIDPYEKIPTPVGGAAGVGCTDFCTGGQHWHLKEAK